MTSTLKLDANQLARQRKKLEKDRRKKVYDDQQVQGTNNSSIVSKRSVEKLYTQVLQPELGEWFQYFVPKGKRRSPAINRGYWIRMELIRQMVIRIIKANSPNVRVNVVNLGCGFDPLAFQLLSLFKNQYNLNFIDIDYPDLVKNKYNMIQQSNEIKQLIGDQGSKSSDLYVMETDNYQLVGCDLKNLAYYKKILPKLVSRNVDPHPTSINIFIAEVSLAYMKPQFANPVIEISSQVNNSHFLILEQIMPDGATNAFATKMLYHFQHLRSPIQCVETYPTEKLQLQRFKQYYKHAEIKNLYGNWKFLIDYQMQKNISTIEEFDEWEEFIIFCQHYVNVHATNMDQLIYGDESSKEHKNEKAFSEMSLDSSVAISHDDRFNDEQLQLKFPAIASFKDKIYVNGGLKQTRNDENLEIDLQTGVITKLDQTENLPTARMCHTLTNLGENLVLIGGRSRPGIFFKDVYMFDTAKKWTRLADLPAGRSRHATVKISDHEVLIFGGLDASSSTTGDELFLLCNTNTNSYTPVKPIGDNDNHPIKNLQSACMIFDGKQGYIFGGMEDINVPIVNSKLYRFELVGENNISVTKVFDHSLLKRIGSKAHILENGDKLLIVGGVSPDQLFTKSTNIVTLDLNIFTFKSVEIPNVISEKVPPIFIGFELVQINNKASYIISGGAVCYSFGSCYNSVYKLEY